MVVFIYVYIDLGFVLEYFEHDNQNEVLPDAILEPDGLFRALQDTNEDRASAHAIHKARPILFRSIPYRISPRRKPAKKVVTLHFDCHVYGYTVCIGTFRSSCVYTIDCPTSRSKYV